MKNKIICSYRVNGRATESSIIVDIHRKIKRGKVLRGFNRYTVNFRFAASFYRYYLGYYAPLLIPLPPLQRSYYAKLSRAWIESGTRSISMLIFVSSLFPGRFDYHYLVLVVISNRGKKAMEIVPDYFYSLFARVSLSRGKIKNEKKKSNFPPRIVGLEKINTRFIPRGWSGSGAMILIPVSILTFFLDDLGSRDQ